MATKTATTTRKTAAAKITEGERAKLQGRTDFKYLADKEPSDLHVRMAKWMTEQTGVEITPKQAQIVAVLRMDYQRSDDNQDALKAQKAASKARDEARRKAAEERIRKQAAKLGIEIA